jgi:hypothetical protein
MTRRVGRIAGKVAGNSSFMNDTPGIFHAMGVRLLREYAEF